MKLCINVDVVLAVWDDVLHRNAWGKSLPGKPSDLSPAVRGSRSRGQELVGGAEWQKRQRGWLGVRKA